MLFRSYADPRGLNLRNDMAHGLLNAGQMRATLASRLIHTLLVFGIWEKLVHARKSQLMPPPERPK